MKHIENFEKRKELAYEKNLIKEENYELYRKILNKYRFSLEQYLNKIINFSALDIEIENIKLHFSPSNKAKEYFKESKLSSKYFFCLNQFYIEKLSIEDIKILERENSVNDEVIEVIQRTLKDIISKEGVTNITYGYASPKRIVKNGTLVLEMILGKTDYNVPAKFFLENKRKQDIFINNITNDIKVKIKKVLDIDVQILISRSV